MGLQLKIGARKRENVQDLLSGEVTGPARRRQPGPDAVVTGVAGWVTFVLLTVILIVFASQNQTALKRIEADHQARLRALQDEVQKRLAESTEQRNKLTDNMNKVVDQINKLNPDIRALEVGTASIRKQVPTLQEQLAKKKANTDAEKEDVQLLGEGKGDLGESYAAMRQERERLMTEYIDKYRTMKGQYEDRVAKADPEVIRGFFSTHQNTPFGPAALFFAAEKIYEKRKSVDAERLYNDLLRKYPDCGYAEHAKSRLARIKEHVPYEKLEGVGLIPYKALSIVQ